MTSPLYAGFSYQPILLRGPAGTQRVGPGTRCPSRLGAGVRSSARRRVSESALSREGRRAGDYEGRNPEGGGERAASEAVSLTAREVRPVLPGARCGSPVVAGRTRPLVPRPDDRRLLRVGGSGEASPRGGARLLRVACGSVAYPAGRS